MTITLIFYIFIFYLIYKNIKPYLQSPYNLLYRVFTTQQFSNISNVYSTSRLLIIRADKSGENYIFGVKKDNSLFTVNDLEKLYSIAQGLHVHTIVIATAQPITSTNSIYRRIREYRIDVWDAKKLAALAAEESSATSSHNYSVLKTVDTSDDTCKIDTNSFDPIQESTLKPHSLFSGLFDRPDRL